MAKKKPKKSRAAIGKKSRSKGQRGERAVVKALTEWWGSEFARTPSSGGFKTKQFRDEWNAASDIVTSDETFPFGVEVKNCEGWHLEQLLTAPKCDLYSWWAQTTDECPSKKIPLLVFTRNHQPLFCMMKHVDWTQEESEPSSSLLLNIPGKHQVLIIPADTLFTTHKESWL